MRMKLPLMRTLAVAPARAPILRYGVAVLSQGLADEGGALQFVEVGGVWTRRDGGGNDLVHGVAFGELGLLRHVADARIAAQGDAAAVGFKLAGKDAEESGLACAVAADQAEALAFGDAERDVFEQQAGAVGFGEAGATSEQRHYSYRSASTGSSCAAFMAGHTPKKTPMITETLKPVMSAQAGTLEGSEGTSAPTSMVMSTAMTIPSMPPAPVSVIASTRN